MNQTSPRRDRAAVIMDSLEAMGLESPRLPSPTVQTLHDAGILLALRGLHGSAARKLARESVRQLAAVHVHQERGA